MSEMKRILLAEDSDNDVEITIAALQECKPANEVVVVRDGAEALDYLFTVALIPAGKPGFSLVSNATGRWISQNSWEPSGRSVCSGLSSMKARPKSPIPEF